MGLYYRPPNSQWGIEDQICRQITQGCENHRVVLVGGFIFHNIDWDSRGKDMAELIGCLQEGFFK